MAVTERGRMRGSEGFPQNTEKPFRQLEAHAHTLPGIAQMHETADAVLHRTIGSTLGYGSSLAAFSDYVGAVLQRTSYSDRAPLATEREAAGEKDDSYPSLQNQVVAFAVTLTALQEGGIPTEGLSTADLLNHVQSDSFTFQVPDALVKSQGRIPQMSEAEVADLTAKVYRENRHFIDTMTDFTMTALRRFLQSETYVARLQGDMLQDCLHAAALTYSILRGPFEEGEGAGDRSPRLGDPNPPLRAAEPLPGGRRPVGAR